MKRTEILEKIYEEMLEIEHLGKGQFRHTAKHILGSLVAANVKKYGLEWDREIIRDETYFCVWKAIKKYENDYTLGELNLLLQQLTTDDEMDGKVELKIYLKSIKKYVELNIKNYLLPEGRKDENRQMIDVFTEATDFEGLDYLLHEEMLENKPSHFMEWCLENWQEVLTLKQIEFMNRLGQETPADEMNLTPLEKSNKQIREKKMRERISTRLINKYSAIYCGNRRYNEALGAIHKIEWLLEQEDFTRALLDNHETDYIIAAIYDYVSIDDIKAFNKATKACEDVPAKTIKAYRVALLKALKSLYEVVEEVK